MISDLTRYDFEFNEQSGSDNQPPLGELPSMSDNNNEGVSGNPDISPDFDQIQAIDDLEIGDYSHIEYAGPVSNYSEDFDSSEAISIVNNQILSDYGDYLGENAKLMDVSTVEIKPGTEFEDNSTYGYYDWANTGKLVVNQDAGGTLETLVHEGLHMAADNGADMNPDGELVYHLGIEEVALDQNTGGVLAINHIGLNEGITELFTRQTAENLGVDDISIAYPDEVEVAQALGDVVGMDALKAAYFNSDVDGLRESVDSNLGEGAFDTINALMDGGVPYAAMMIIQDGMPPA